MHSGRRQRIIAQRHLPASCNQHKNKPYRDSINLTRHLGLSAALLSPQQLNSRLPPAAAKRNPYVELEQDLLPGGVPNTPWRRLLLRIKNTWTLRQLLELYAANHYKTAVFNDKHRTALFNRIPSLIYYR